ncbi:MAG: translesion DNA synthesis-associated protein ImuA [Methylococcaceae bacterium]|nr:translesion DNA synthesis-associated protein ImuA [Methylococcaceae bacterium]
MNPALQQLLSKEPGIWRGLRSESSTWRVVASGFPELDALLPGGGWPLGALMEILTPCLGVGELRILLPAMAALSLTGRWIAWVAPPHQPYAPALVQAGIRLSQLLIVESREASDIPWSLEKLLSSGGCGMALAWPGRLSAHQTRRLQLAAEQGNALAALFPAQTCGSGHAALRLEVRPTPEGLALNIVKARGSLSRESLILPI